MVCNHPCFLRTEGSRDIGLAVLNPIVLGKSGCGHGVGPPLPQPRSFHDGYTFSPLSTPQPQDTHPLPVSPAPHYPLHSQHSHHLLEMTLNSLPFSGPQSLPLSAEEVGADVPKSPGAPGALVLPPGSDLGGGLQTGEAEKLKPNLGSLGTTWWQVMGPEQEAAASSGCLSMDTTDVSGT